jgi:hypothetical protein
LFIEAVKLVEQANSAQKGLEAARNWILGIELMTLDVRSLNGIGPLYEQDWKQLRNTSAFRSMLAAQPSRKPTGDVPGR